MRQGGSGAEKMGKPIDQIDDYLSEIGESALVADGFDDAVIGITTTHLGNDICIVYDADRCIEILMERDEMSYDVAVEYFDFNVAGAYVENGPVFVVKAKNLPI